MGSLIKKGRNPSSVKNFCEKEKAKAVATEEIEIKDGDFLKGEKLKTCLHYAAKNPRTKRNECGSRREQGWRGAARDQPPAGVYSLLLMAHAATTSHSVPVA